MTNSSTDDREENQEFINRQVEEMLARIRLSQGAMVSKLKNTTEDRFRRRAVSLVPEVLDDEFSEQSFSKVEEDS